MKNIKEPECPSAVRLTPAEMNRIHFGGIHTPLTPEQLEAIARAAAAPAPGQPATSPSHS